MKHIKLLFTTLFFASLLSQCAHFPIRSTTIGTKNIPGRPPHLGEGQHGFYGLCEYTVFRESVLIDATSGDLPVSSIEIYDLNHDGMLDSVFALDRGDWKFATRLDSKGRIIPRTDNQSPLLDYIGLANYARRSVEEQKAKLQKKPERMGTLEKQFETMFPLQSIYPD